MTKVEIISKLSESLELPKRELERIFEKLVTIIQQELKKEEKVSLAGLGTFVVTHKKARTARNPKTGETVEVPAKKAPKFKASKELKELVK